MKLELKFVCYGTKKAFYYDSMKHYWLALFKKRRHIYFIFSNVNENAQWKMFNAWIPKNFMSTVLHASTYISEEDNFADSYRTF